MEYFFEKIKSITNTAQQNLDTLRKISVALAWIGEVINQDDHVLVITAKGSEYYEYPFPRRLGDLPVKCTRMPIGFMPTFIIDANGGYVQKDYETWTRIFYSRTFSVYESRMRTLKNKPLRWGLTKEEGREALAYARAVLEQFLQNGNAGQSVVHRPVNFSSRFFMHTDVDVTLWVDGRMRGSRIIESLQLHEGIYRGVIAASRDVRFKPIMQAELKNICIELVIFSPLRVPLSNLEMEEKDIWYPMHGFLLEYGGRRGWLLPAVFNTIHITSFSQFLKYLAEVKVGIPFALSKKRAHSMQFEVDTIVEGGDEHTDFFPVWGTVARNCTPVFNGRILSPVRAAMDWIAIMQEGDGNLTVSLNPLNGISTQYDLIRAAFAVGAMAEYVSKNKELKDLFCGRIENHFRFVRMCMGDATVVKTSLTYCYVIQEALGLWELTRKEIYLKDALEWAHSITSEDSIKGDPILVQQTASTLFRILPHMSSVQQSALAVAEFAREQFMCARTENNSIQFARYAELVAVFARIYTFQKRREYAEFSLEVANWILSYAYLHGQKNTGPFPAATNGGLPYTRGVAKIAEVFPYAASMARVLGKDPSPFSQATTHAIHWLEEMQYNDGNSYFIAPDIRSRVLGGIRHDLVNPEAHIDAVGHYLLALSRIDEHPSL